MAHEPGKYRRIRAVLDNVYVNPPGQATGQPAQPSAQATGQPSAQATGQPSAQATGQPLAQATGQPSAQATGQASDQAQDDLESYRRTAARSLVQYQKDKGEIYQLNKACKKKDDEFKKACKEKIKACKKKDDEFKKACEEKDETIRILQERIRVLENEQRPTEKDLINRIA